MYAICILVATTLGVYSYQYFWEIYPKSDNPYSYMIFISMPIGLLFSLILLMAIADWRDVFMVTISRRMYYMIKNILDRIIFLLTIIGITLFLLIFFTLIVILI